MKKEFIVREGGRTVIGEKPEDKKDKASPKTPKPEVTKEDDDNVDQS